ncbi:DUF2937 family protein [Primorskyibacter sp. S187A]|uniref:DUF2937 family protein n=1 Tax=Primorskyibacter sp. S187A TaxID=3415130 RepID=UPI003C7D54DA
MILRSISLALGVAGAAGLSQFPEFSQQYTQRLGGAVDALEEVVADFDASAASAGLTREAALAELSGSAFLIQRQADMTRTIERAERLSADLELLSAAGPFTRAYYAARLTDTDIARAAWAAYKPAAPLTFEGMVFAVIGFLGGIAGAKGIARLMGLLLPRRTRGSDL